MWDTEENLPDSETPKLRFLWRADFHSTGQFVEYLMIVYFSKPTLADLIVTHIGLQSLLLECGKMEVDGMLKSEFMSQAMLCQRNLENILTGLPFNLPCTPDYALALLMVVSPNLPHCKGTNSANIYAVKLLPPTMSHIHVMEHPRRRRPNVPNTRLRSRHPSSTRNTRGKTAACKVSLVSSHKRQDARPAAQPTSLDTRWRDHTQF
jgi:hypothetical protein